MGAFFMVGLGIWNDNLGSPRNILQGVLFGVGVTVVGWIRGRRQRG
jgi:hypothetical protein